MPALIQSVLTNLSLNLLESYLYIFYGGDSGTLPKLFSCGFNNIFIMSSLSILVSV